MLPTSPFRTLLVYVRRRPVLHGLALGCVIVAAISGTSVHYGMKLMVDAMAAVDTDLVWQMLLLFLGLIAAENILWRISGWAGARAVIADGVDLRLDLFQHLTGHGARYFAEHFTGALAGRLGAASAATEAIGSALVWRVIPPITAFVGSVALLVSIDWAMALVLASGVILVAMILSAVNARGRPLHADFGARAATAGGALVDMVTNIWNVRAFAAAALERARLATALEDEATSHRRSWMYTERMRLLHDACMWSIGAAMLVWAILRWRMGQLSAGDVVVISTLSFASLNGSRDLALALADVTHHLGRLSDALNAILAPHELRDLPGAPALQTSGGEIQFDRVNFSYPDGTALFQDFSLTIPSGQKVGIVGPSGAGKSTLLALVQRVYDPDGGPDGGRVLIDGQELASVGQESVRRAIAVVPQEISLFHRSVMENIRYGRPDATDEEVVAAAMAARCHGFIRRLPDGYRTEVGERGLKLSGGQRQRVGIARALLKNAPIIVLDEATSALDSRSELEIQEALAELVRGRTVLAVAHRLSTLSSFDRIIVLDHGKVVEDGTPSDLLDGAGHFEEMWRLQARAYRKAA